MIMNIKKRLKEIAKEDRQSLMTEQDKALFDSLGIEFGEIPSPVKVKTLNPKAIISLACVFVAAVTVFLIIYYSLMQPSDNYFGDFVVESEQSTISELNSDLVNFTVNLEDKNYYIIKNYDIISNSSLYYTIQINDRELNLVEYELLIIVNENYVYDKFKFNDDKIKETTLYNFSLKYTQVITPLEMYEGVNDVSCRAKLEIGVQTLYVVEYRELSLGEGTFLKTLQSIINIK